MPGGSRQTGLWCVPVGTRSLDLPPRWHRESPLLRLTAEGGVEIGLRAIELLELQPLLRWADPSGPGVILQPPRGWDSRAAARAWEGALGLCRPRPLRGDPEPSMDHTRRCSHGARPLRAGCDFRGTVRSGPR